MEGTVRGVQGWIDCFSDVRLAGAVYGIGAEEAGSIRETPAFGEAYQMGKSVR